MKANTNLVKELLYKALQASPNDFALQEAKFHIKQALNKIESVEKKRINRDILQKQEEKQREERKNNPNFNLNTTIDQLDKMIQEEKANLEKMANKKKEKIENDNMDTIFG